MSTKRLILSLVLGTLALFTWNALSWIVLPFHGNSLHNLPPEAIDQEFLRTELPADGVYHFPGHPEGNSEAAMSALMDRLERGPRIPIMMVKRGSTGFFEPSAFLLNLLFNFLTAAGLLWLCLQLKYPTRKRVLAACLAAGALVGLASDLPQMNWYLFPLEFTLPTVMDHLVGFGLIGAVLAFYMFRNSHAAEENLA